MDKLFIPKKIKVGYQERSDTYTKKLAYVIYYDNKNVLRKETSWEGWRDKEIEPSDIDNVPTSGFVLNRDGGGNGRGWDSRKAFIRVWDPRDFEFEISVENLLFILQECTSTQGKGLEGDFVYSWAGKELVLLPVCSQDYRNSNNFTNLQSQKVTKDQMIPGYSYKFKDTTVSTYLGRYEYFQREEVTKENPNSRYRYDKTIHQHYKIVSKKYHIFLDENNNYRIESGFTKIAEIVSDIVVSNYAELIDTFYKSEYGSKPLKYHLENFNLNYDNCEINSYNNLKEFGCFYIEYKENILKIDIGENIPYRYNNVSNTQIFIKIKVENIFTIDNKDGLISKSKYYSSITEEFYNSINANGNSGYDKTITYQQLDILKNNLKLLYIEMESGSQIHANNYIL